MLRSSHILRRRFLTCSHRSSCNISPLERDVSSLSLLCAKRAPVKASQALTICSLSYSGNRGRIAMEKWSTAPSKSSRSWETMPSTVFWAQTSTSSSTRRGVRSWALSSNALALEGSSVFLSRNSVTDSACSSGLVSGLIVRVFEYNSHLPFYRKRFYAA